MAYEDLLKDTSESFEDGNYFLVTITELDLATQYPLEFRWKYKDGTFGKDWSGVYYVTTPGSTVPLEPNLDVSDVVGGAGFISVTWNGKDASNNTVENIDRVDIYISGTSFPDGKPAGSFKESGTQTFTAVPGIYIVQLKAVRVDGTTSFFSSARTVTVTEVGEPIEAPVAPNGFSARAILGGIELTWNGTYTGGATWSGFQAVNIYAGTSTAATSGTYIKVGQMTANKTTNKIVIPIDGTYVRYGFPAYIHASSINKATPPVESSISSNVASSTPSQVVNTDLINEAITSTKLALGAVTNTKIADDAITTPKILAGAITTGKIDALAITSDKIAALAITAGKIDTNAITADLINSGTLKATTYVRVGTDGGGRIDIAASSSGIPAGLYIYNSGGTAVFSAPLGGGVSITGALTATTISTSSGNFSVNSSGILTAQSANITGTIKATAGFIGGETSGIYIASGAIQNNASGSQFKLDSSGKARFGSSSANAIIIDPTAAVGGYYIYHSSDGGAAASGKFSVSTGGVLTATGANFSGTITNGTDYWNANGTFRIGGASGIDYNGSSIAIGSAATFSGSLSAASGTFSGTLQASSGYFGSAIDGWQFDSNGYLYAPGGGSYLYPTISPGGNANNYVLISTDRGISATKGVFTGFGSALQITNGDLEVVGTGTLTGRIYANGGITVGSNRSIAMGTGNITTGGNISSLGTVQGVSLEVTGNGSTSGSGWIIANYLGTGSGLAIHQVQSGTYAGYLRVNTSTIRHKENINYINSSGYLNKVAEMNPVFFTYKENYGDTNRNEIGLIAEDLENLGGFETILHYNNDGELMGISYDKLSAMLILAIKELKQKLDALEG